MSDRPAPEGSAAKRALLAAVLLCAAAAAGCSASLPADVVPATGTYTENIDIRYRGFRRSYRVHVPAGYDATAGLPLVVAIHGAFSGARELEQQSEFSEIADRESFVVAYPNGIGIFGLFRHWNSGHCCARARAANIDDIGFVAAVIADVEQKLRIDPARIYVVGHSNGGMLTHRIAAEGRIALAAAATIAATIGGTPSSREAEWVIPAPARPVPILLMHGRADQRVPYDGGRGPKSRGPNSAIAVSRSTDFWVTNNGCNPQPARTTEFDGQVTRDAWGGCTADAEVILYTLETWGHNWPGPLLIGTTEGGETLQGFSAAEVIWDFLKNH